MDRRQQGPQCPLAGGLGAKPWSQSWGTGACCECLVTEHLPMELGQAQPKWGTWVGLPPAGGGMWVRCKGDSWRQAFGTLTLASNWSQTPDPII